MTMWLAMANESREVSLARLECQLASSGRFHSIVASVSLMMVQSRPRVKKLTDFSTVELPIATSEEMVV